MRTGAGDHFRTTVAIEIDEGDCTQWMHAANDVRAARSRQPDANEPGLACVERDAVAAAVGIEVRKHTPPTSFCGGGGTHRTQAQDDERLGDANRPVHSSPEVYSGRTVSAA